MKNRIKRLLIGSIPVLCIGFIFIIYSPMQSGKENIQKLAAVALDKTITIDFHQRNNMEIKSKSLPLNRKVKGMTIMGENGMEVIHFKDSIEEYLANQLAAQYMLIQMHPINPDDFNAIFEKELAKRGITVPTGIIYRHKEKYIYSNNDSLTPLNAITTLPIAIDIKKSASVQAWTKCDWITVLRHSNKEAFWTVILFLAATALTLSYKGKKKIEPKSENLVIEDKEKGIRINEEKQKVYIDGNECHFTEIRFRLMALFINEPDHFVTREKMIQTLWPGELTTDRALLNNRLDGHIKSIRDDLKEYPQYEIKIEIKVGYQLIIHT